MYTLRVLLNRYWLMQQTPFSPIRWHDNHLYLLDQRLLPEKQQELVCQTLEQAATAISDLVVRGAPAIGITAAYAVYLGFRQSRQDPAYDLDAALEFLTKARPTAVNLAWAVSEQKKILQVESENTAEMLLVNAKKIHVKDIEHNQLMGDFGAELIKPGSRVLTHCNAGALATGGYGTALGVIRSAWAAQKLECVFASETRPWLQGLRLTAWELAQDGIEVDVITEGAVSSLFSQQNIQWVIVGADRVCANGDVINKVGTANLAILARHYGVSFMVVAPLSTIDTATESGELVPIEQREQSEILGTYYQSENRVSAWNPVFDLTPAGLVSALVTEKGVVLSPDKQKITDHLRLK